MGSERVSLSSKTLSTDKRCSCRATGHQRMGDYALFVCSSFFVIVTLSYTLSLLFVRLLVLCNVLVTQRVTGSLI